jgi:hypothetical protein
MNDMKGFAALFSGAIAIFKEQPKLFVGIYLVPGVLTFLLTLLGAVEGSMGLGKASSGVLTAIVGIALAVASIFMSIAMIKAVMQPSLTVKEAYRMAVPYFWRYIVLSILVSIAIIVGFVLLIVPGIIFMVWFTFAYYVLVDENTGAIDAMKRSKALVAGKWLAVFGRIVVLMIVGLVIGMVFGALGGMFGGTAGAITIAAVVNLVVNAVLTPISVAYLYLMYRDLKGLPAAAQPMDAGYPASESPAI